MPGTWRRLRAVSSWRPATERAAGTDVQIAATGAAQPWRGIALLSELRAFLCVPHVRVRAMTAVVSNAALRLVPVHQSEGIARIDLVLEWALAVHAGELVDLADPVVDHRLGRVMPGVVEAGHDQRFG